MTAGGVRRLDERFADQSGQQVHYIELVEPADRLEYSPEKTDSSETLTIGEFYKKIIASITTLGEAAFAHGQRNQVGSDLMDGSIVVTDVASATDALSTIIAQGEGGATSPLDGDPKEFAHYYRFMEIKQGHQLVAVADPSAPDGSYSYTGDPVPFASDGVFAVPSDPTSSGFPNGYFPGSARQHLNDSFNCTYTNLLRVLDGLVNGQATGPQFAARSGS